MQQMKKLLFLLLVIVLFSCEKEQYFCWQCDTKAKNFESSIITCEKTVDEIKDFQTALQLQATAMTDSIATVICNEIECRQF